MSDNIERRDADSRIWVIGAPDLLVRSGHAARRDAAPPGQRLLIP